MDILGVGLDRRSDLLDRTLAELGVPAWDVVGARNGERRAFWELTGDRADVLGELHVNAPSQNGPPSEKTVP